MIKIPWQQKPHRGIQLNRKHPLTQGLVACYIMNERSGEKIFDFAGNNTGTIEGATWKANGVDFSSANTNKINYGTFDCLNGVTSLSVFSIFRTTTTANGGLFSQRSDAAGTYRWQTWRYNSKLYARISNHLGVISSAAGNATISVGDFHSSALTWSSGLGVKSFLDGVLDDQGTGVAGELVTSCTHEVQMGWSYDTSFGLVGDIVLGWVYDRELLAEEIKSLHDDPYQIFNLIEMPFYVVLGGGEVSIPVLYHHYNQLRRG